MSFPLGLGADLLGCDAEVGGTGEAEEGRRAGNGEDTSLAGDVEGVLTGVPGALAASVVLFACFFAGMKGNKRQKEKRCPPAVFLCVCRLCFVLKKVLPIAAEACILCVWVWVCAHTCRCSSEHTVRGTRFRETVGRRKEEG
jgi:hypothetical protein